MVLGVIVLLAVTTTAMAMARTPDESTPAAIGRLTGRLTAAYQLMAVRGSDGPASERQRLVERGNVDLAESSLVASIEERVGGRRVGPVTRLRTVDGSSYERVIGTGEGWVATSPNVPVAGLTAAQRLWTWQYDLVELTGLLDQVTDSLTEVGTTSVREIPTTRYRLTVDLSTLAAAGVDTSVLDGATTATLWLWVDGGGQLRRIGTENPALVVTQVDGRVQTEVYDKVQLELWDFGSPVRVEVPEAVSSSG